MTEAKHETTWTDLLAQLGILVFIGTPVDLLKAFVLTQLWGWFITPFGPAAPHLLHAYGIIILISLLRNRYRPTDNDGPPVTHSLKLASYSVGLSLTAWGMGAIIMALSS